MWPHPITEPDLSTESLVDVRIPRVYEFVVFVTALCPGGFIGGAGNGPARLFPQREHGGTQATAVDDCDTQLTMRWRKVNENSARLLWHHGLHPLRSRKTKTPVRGNLASC